MRLFTDMPKETMTQEDIIAYLAELSRILREITLRINMLEKK